MKHLIDYNTLKKWGFIWGSKGEFNGETVCTSYILEDTGYTDMFLFQPISLAWYPDTNLHVIWFLTILGDNIPFNGILFKGAIKDKESLEVILKSCIVFKQTKQQIKTREFFSVAFNIPQKEIDEATIKYRKSHPKDKRTDEELRPYAIISIMRNRRENR